MQRNRLVSSAAAAALLLTATGCPASKETLELSGSVGAGYRGQAVAAPLTGRVTLAATGAPTVNQVMALVSERGRLSPTSVEDAVTSDVGSDGSFSLALDTSKDWVLVLLDTTQTDPVERFGAYVNLTESGLLLLPATAAEVKQVDLGRVDPPAEGDSAVPEKPVSEAAFTLTASDLAALARADDAFKGVKNYLVNYAGGTFYTLRPDFRWRAGYEGLDHAFSDPGSYVPQGYNFQLDSNSGAVTMARVCPGADQVAIELRPPAGSALAVVDNAGVTCQVAADGKTEASSSGFGFYASDRYEDVTLSLGGQLEGTIPGGWWEYWVAGERKAIFDVAVAAPVTAAGLPKGPVPSVKIDTDASGRIVGAELRWYALEGDSFVEIVDLATLEHLIGTGDVFFDRRATDVEGRRYESVHFDPARSAVVVPQQTWYFGAAGSELERAGSIGVFYEAAGVGYFFEFHQQL